MGTITVFHVGKQTQLMPVLPNAMPDFEATLLEGKVILSAAQFTPWIVCEHEPN